jgi:hypothetical protein
MHFACSKTGYTEPATNMYWIQNVCDPGKIQSYPANERLCAADETYFRTQANLGGLINRLFVCWGGAGAPNLISISVGQVTIMENDSTHAVGIGTGLPPTVKY